jgi:EmrB/QacA subfamily drug resistance transporter
MTAASPAAATPGVPAGVDPDVYERRWWILSVLVLSLVLVVAGNSSLNVALPTLVRELGATQTQLQWLVDAYALVFAGLLLPAGALGDRYGRKGALQFGLVVFGAATLAASFADTPTQVIVLRALMGVGSAFVMPATLSLLTSAFPPGERAKAIAIWAGFAGAGGAIGTISSGILLAHYGWGSVFLVNLPIVAVALVAGWRLVPTSRDSRRRPLDPVGSLLSVVGLGAVLFAIIEGPNLGWGSVEVVAGFVVGGLAIVVFGWWERRIEHPMLDLTWFRDRRFSAGASTITLAFFAMFGVFFLLTQYLQFVLGYSPLRAGLASLPMAAAMIYSAPRSAGLVTRFGPRRVVTAGLLMFAVGLGSFALLSPTTPYVQIGVTLVILGLGAGMVMPPSTGQIMSAMPLDKAGVGSAVNDTVREIGGATGVAILGSITTVAYRGGLADVLAAAPAEVRAAAESSVAVALQVAANAPDPTAAATAVKVAFTDGIGLAFVAAAVASLVNAVLVWRYAPRVASHHEIGTVPEPAPVPAA